MRKERPKGELTGGSVFSGIGGLDLGFERAGIRTLWQIENNPFCQAVLARRFPHAVRRRDARKKHKLPRVDVLFGGFPCQPISNAGRSLGERDPRWLWPVFHRWIDEYAPRWVVIENVEGLRVKGLQEILQGLADGGYDAEWDRLPAAAFGAPHLRKRFFIVAYPEGRRRDERPIVFREPPSERHVDQRRPLFVASQRKARFVTEGAVTGRAWWRAEPQLDRVAYGIPDRVDRLVSLGNAVVPQVAEFIGKQIVSYEQNAA